MKSIISKITALALLPAAVIALTSCSSTPTFETTSAASFQQGVPGGVVVETHKLTATVTGIDAANRKVTLVNPDGKKATIKCRPEVINFDQIHVGDQLNLTVTEEIVVSMATDAAPPGDGAVTVVTLAPKGAKPGAVTASTEQVTATVAAINLKQHKATLLFPDGTSKTFKVRKDVDLTKQTVDAEVVIRTTEAVAISIEKP